MVVVVVDAVGAHRLRQRPGEQGAEAYNQRAGDGEAPLRRRQVEGRLRAVVAPRGQHLFLVVRGSPCDVRMVGEAALRCFLVGEMQPLRKAALMGARCNPSTRSDG